MNEYRELINSFCELQKDKKKNEIRDELQEILMLFHKLCKEKNINSNILVHEEMKKLQEGYVSEDEFLNAIYAYIISIKENIGMYFS